MALFWAFFIGILTAYCAESQAGLTLNTFERAILDNEKAVQNDVENKDDGFKLQQVTNDIDECTNQSHKCHKRAICKNIPGSYLCMCKTGFVGNGINVCDDLNECAFYDPCNGRGTCVNTFGSFTCP